LKYLIVTFLFIANLSIAQELESDWALGSCEGTATSGQEQTTIRINIRETLSKISVDIDLLDIGVIGIPARNTRITQNTLEFQIPSDSGVQPVLLEREGNSLLGIWTESGRGDASLLLEPSELFVTPNEQRLGLQGKPASWGCRS
jgi:hypothetical protein